MSSRSIVVLREFLEWNSKKMWKEREKRFRKEERQISNSFYNLPFVTDKSAQQIDNLDNTEIFASGKQCCKCPFLFAYLSMNVYQLTSLSLSQFLDFRGYRTSMNHSGLECILKPSQTTEQINWILEKLGDQTLGGPSCWPNYGGIFFTSRISPENKQVSLKQW